MVRRILVGLGSHLTLASEVEHALELAERYSAELTGVTIVDTRAVTSVGAVPLGAGEAATQLERHRRAAAAEHIEAAVAAFDAACRRAHVRYQIKREERADPFDRLISESRYHDLVICGLRGIFESGLVGSSATENGETLARLVGSGVRPLLAVAPQFRRVGRVMIAYSGSVESAKAMKQFMLLRPWRDFQLRVCVFNHTPEKASRLLESADEYCRAHGRQAELVHIPGSPHDQIVPAALDWNADLLVLGNSARSLLLRKVLGETALRVMQTSTIPLFLSQ